MTHFKLPKFFIKRSTIIVEELLIQETFNILCDLSQSSKRGQRIKYKKRLFRTVQQSEEVKHLKKKEVRLLRSCVFLLSKKLKAKLESYVGTMLS